MVYFVTRIKNRTKKNVKKIWVDMTSPVMSSVQRLSDEAFLAKFKIEAVAEALQQGNILAAKEALLAHYAYRMLTNKPVFPDIISDIAVKISDLTAQELITRADDILQNKPFSGLKYSVQVTPKGKINWTANPDVEAGSAGLWRLNRHGWWPILALAYAETNDERYANAFVTQMLDWIETNPPLTKKDEHSPTWRLMEVGLRIRVSWIPCFAFFYNSPSFTAEAKLKMLRAIYDHAQFLFLFKTNRNHLLRESNGLAYTSVYFPEFDMADRWRQVALNRLDQELEEQINQDGTQIEVSTGYQWLVIDEFQTTFDLLQSHNLSLPTKNLGKWLEKMYNVQAYVVRPDKTYPQLNDGFLHWDCTELIKAGEVFNRKDFTYIGTDGRRGDAPEKTSISFKDAGWYVMRSDWSKEARYLIFDAGPYGGPHGHEDKLNIEIFAFGQPFIVDPGSYTYNDADPFRAYFVGSQGHNTVLVDGQSQIRRWQNSNLHPKTALGNYALWISQAHFDYVAATYNEGYSAFSLKKPKDTTIISDVSHTRQVLFVKPDYWLIVDELKSDSPHTYELLFHTAPEIRAETGAHNRVILNAPSSAAKLHLIPVEAQNLNVNCVSGSETPIQGWHSPSMMHKTPATTVIYKRENSVSTIFSTLLYPCIDDRAGEDVTIEPLIVSGGNGLAFKVITPVGSDCLMLSQDGLPKRFGDYQSKCNVAGFRTDIKGNITTQFETYL